MSAERYEYINQRLNLIYQDYRFMKKFPSRKKEFSFAVPINLAQYYAELDEPKEKLMCLIHLQEIHNLEYLANYIKRLKHGSIKNYYNLTTGEIDSLYLRYESFFEEFEKKEVSFESTIWHNDTLDQDLIRLMRSIITNDQKYRTGNPKHDLEHQTEQDSLDRFNIEKIDSLYNHYGSYVGESLVGSSNEYIMWAVIQHASLDKQEFYLPILQKAVENFDVNPNTLRYLIDRIYHKKYNYQIYGSQGGVLFGTDRQVRRTKRKFNLE